MMSFISPQFIIIQMFITVYFLIPRMGEFLGNVSVAEAMGDIYGKEIRLITAICGILKMVGGIAVQFKVFGNIFNYFLPNLIHLLFLRLDLFVV